MAKELLNVVGDYSVEREPKIDAQRTINMYLINSPESKTGHALIPFPGTQLKITLPVSITNIRNEYKFKNTLYAVAENKIYAINTSEIATELGTITTSGGYVSIAANQTQIIFVDGIKGWIYDTSTSTFSEITAAGFATKPESVVYLDGYFVVNNGDTNKFQISALNDGTSWDALQFAYMQSQPDVIVAIQVLKRRLFIFGKNITEIWYNAGTSPFPFARDNNMLLEYGCAAKGGISVGFQKMFWLSGDKNGVGSIMMTDGSSFPSPVSTTQVDYAIQRYTAVDDGRSMIYKEDGHIFYELSFTTDNHTWIYDATSSHWLEGQTLDGNRRKFNSHEYFNNKHYVGAYNEGKIYQLSSDFYTDNGIAILRERITGHFTEPHMRVVRITRLQLDLIPGIGNIINSEYENPKIFLSYSKDGGKSYLNEISREMGRIGERTHRCIWRRLGTSRDWVFRFRYYGKSPLYILNASIDYEISGR